jgi:hypothetical protein
MENVCSPTRHISQGVKTGTSLLHQRMVCEIFNKFLLYRHNMPGQSRLPSVLGQIEVKLPATLPYLGN